MSARSKIEAVLVRGACALGLAVLLAPAAVAASTVGKPAAAPALRSAPAESVTAPPARRPSVRDSPGWYPMVDPESSSIALGRRVNAPLVSTPLKGGLRSLDAIGRAVCWAFHHQQSDTLAKLCASMEEFRDIMWREFPQSRPVTGLTWEDAWIILNARLGSGVRGAVQDYDGHFLEFVRWERRDSVALYKNFKLHNGLVLVARNGEGVEERFDFLRSVIERKGAFKIYSVRD